MDLVAVAIVVEVISLVVVAEIEEEIILDFWPLVKYSKLFDHGSVDRHDAECELSFLYYS